MEQSATEHWVRRCIRPAKSGRTSTGSGSTAQRSSQERRQLRRQQQQWQAGAAQRDTPRQSSLSSSRAGPPGTRRCWPAPRGQHLPAGWLAAGGVQQAPGVRAARWPLGGGPGHLGRLLAQRPCRATAADAQVPSAAGPALPPAAGLLPARAPAPTSSANEAACSSMWPAQAPSCGRAVSSSIEHRAGAPWAADALRSPRISPAADKAQARAGQRAARPRRKQPLPAKRPPPCPRRTFFMRLQYLSKGSSSSTKGAKLSSAPSTCAITRPRSSPCAPSWPCAEAHSTVGAAPAAPVHRRPAASPARLCQACDPERPRPPAFAAAAARTPCRARSTHVQLVGERAEEAVACGGGRRGSSHSRQAAASRSRAAPSCAPGPCAAARPRDRPPSAETSFTRSPTSASSASRSSLA